MKFLFFILYGQLLGSDVGVVKRAYQEIVIDKEGYTQVLEKSILVKSERARDDYGTVVIPFDESLEKPRVVYARTILPNGDTINVTPNAINIVADPVVESFPFLSNRKELHVSFIGMEPGALIEYRVEIKGKKRDYVDGSIFLKEEIPCELRTLKFIISKDLSFRYSIFNVGDLAVNESSYDSAGYRVFVISSENIPGIPTTSRWEDQIPRYILSPSLVFTTIPSWDSLTKILKNGYSKEAQKGKKRFNLKDFASLKDKIECPEYTGFNIQGIVPIDYNRALNSFSMTLPEKAFRLISEFEGVYPAFVLKYGVDTTLAPSFSLIKDIVLVNGKDFISLSSANKKPLNTNLAYHTILLFDSLWNAEFKKADVGSKNVSEGIVDLNRKIVKMKFQTFLSSVGYEDEEDEEIPRYVKGGLENELASFGELQKKSVKTKNLKSLDKPYEFLLSGKYKSIGSPAGNYLVINLPRRLKYVPEFKPQGVYFWNDEELYQINKLVVVIPKGYKIVYLPPSWKVETPFFEEEMKVESIDRKVVIQSEIRIKERYLSPKAFIDIIKAIQGESKNSLNEVIVLERG